jgi:hypothetical protein
MSDDGLAYVKEKVVEHRRPRRRHRSCAPRAGTAPQQCPTTLADAIDAAEVPECIFFDEA